jgi:hypothetical protein
MSPPIDSGVARFIIDGQSPGTREETFNSLNAAFKPISCEARLTGGALEITTEPITDPGRLRVRQQYLQLVSGLHLRFGGPAPAKESELVLLKSDDDELIINEGLLRRFHEEYEVPYSSSESEEDLKAYGSFVAVTV